MASAVLNHTIVRSHDKWASAEFFAHIMGMEVITDSPTDFAPVRINNDLFFDYSDERQPVVSEHYAFHVSDEDFDAIFERVKTSGVKYGSEPFVYDDQPDADEQVYIYEWGGRGLYFLELNGHSIEIFTHRSPDGSYPP